jgi:hypothetical protein
MKEVIRSRISVHFLSDNSTRHPETSTIIVMAWASRWVYLLTPPYRCASERVLFSRNCGGLIVLSPRTRITPSIWNGVMSKFMPASPQVLRSIDTEWIHVTASARPALTGKRRRRWKRPYWGGYPRAFANFRKGDPVGEIPLPDSRNRLGTEIFQYCFGSDYVAGWRDQCESLRGDFS